MNKMFILNWMNELRKKHPLQFRRIKFSDSKSWMFDNGGLRHKSGGFFSIRGIHTASHADRKTAEQPIIHQPENGILGMILHGSKILVQAKTEPGNIDALQLAPTVQATQSNYTRLHGGNATPYLEYFTSPSARISNDTLQSEHGARFMNKYNRNMLVTSAEELEPAGEHWKWIEVRSLLGLLQEDFCINTDLRSALVCCDWPLLCQNSQPFSDRKNDFSMSLSESLNHQTDAPLEVLNQWRAQTRLEITTKSLQDLEGWEITPEKIRDKTGAEFEIRMFDIHASNREVEHWDQPLLYEILESTHVLICQQRNGLLHFLLHGTVEPGYLNKVQFAPSISLRHKADLPPVLKDLLQSRFSLHAGCSQSEEGGRFFRSIGHYKVVEIPEGANFPAETFSTWATLGDIHVMLGKQGFITNELRSALSLLLVYL